MIYLKSFLAGVAALVLATLILIGIALAYEQLYVQLFIRKHPEGGIGFEEWSINPWLILATAMVIFAAGFYWNFQRTRHHP